MPVSIGDHLESPAERAGEVRESVDIAAPADDVFRALVDPRELAAWLGGEPAPIDSPDDPPSAPPMPGAHWRSPAIAPDGTSGTVAGEYLSVVPPRRLETTWRASWNDFAAERVRFELVPIEVGGVEGTRVTVTHTRAEARLTVATTARSRAAAGSVGDAWPSLLAGLAVHVATMRALGPAVGFDALHRAVMQLHHAR